MTCYDTQIFITCPKVDNNNNNNNNNNNIQCRAIQNEFELVGPTLLKDPFGEGWVYCLPCNDWLLVFPSSTE
jgi:hypothetical protein